MTDWMGSLDGGWVIDSAVGLVLGGGKRVAEEGSGSVLGGILGSDGPPFLCNPILGVCFKACV